MRLTGYGLDMGARIGAMGDWIRVGMLFLILAGISAVAEFFDDDEMTAHEKAMLRDAYYSTY